MKFYIKKTDLDTFWDTLLDISSDAWMKCDRVFLPKSLIVTNRPLYKLFGFKEFLNKKQIKLIVKKLIPSRNVDVDEFISIFKKSNLITEL